MDAIDELKKDIAELEQLASQATRSKVKDILSIEVRKLQTDLIHKQEVLQRESAQAAAEATKISTTVAPKPTRYTKDITTYAWDQSEKFMKIYVTLDKVDSIPSENVTAEFTDRTAKLTVQDLGGSDHRCGIGRLFDDIIPSESYHKVKKDMVLLMLKKKNIKKTWAYVTEREAKAKDPKVPDSSGDPSDNLMSLLKNMYEEGDDSMKRTIAEAWSKSATQAP